jgi:hypothetical protein
MIIWGPWAVIFGLDTERGWAEAEWGERFMNPEWRHSTTRDLKEEIRWDWLHFLYKVLADQEAAFAEVRACTEPPVSIGSIFFIYRKVNICMLTSTPFLFESTSP